MPGIYITNDPLLEELAHSAWAHVPQNEIPASWRELLPPAPVADMTEEARGERRAYMKAYREKGPVKLREKQLKYRQDWYRRSREAAGHVVVSRARRRAQKQEDMRIRTAERRNMERLVERERRAS